MFDLFAQFATALLGAALGALAAAYYGVRFATDRLKKERGFDRRLEWYESAITALDECRTWLRDHRHNVEKGNKELAHHALVNAVIALEEFLAVKHLGRMYATTLGFTALSVAVSAASEAQRSLTDESSASPDDSDLPELEKAMMSAQILLVLEARGHLGLEPLELRHLVHRRGGAVKMDAEVERHLKVEETIRGLFTDRR